MFDANPIEPRDLTRVDEEQEMFFRKVGRICRQHSEGGLTPTEVAYSDYLATACQRLADALAEHHAATGQAVIERWRRSWSPIDLPGQAGLAELADNCLVHRALDTLDTACQAWAAIHARLQMTSVSPADRAFHGRSRTLLDTWRAELRLRSHG